MADHNGRNKIMDFSTIKNDIHFFCSTTSATYSDANVVRNVNGWFNKTVSWILESDNRWQWDDKNNEDLPVGECNLVSGQKNYQFDSQWLKVLRVDVQDGNGNWVKLTPLDQADIIGGYDQFENVSGVPQYYDTIGESLVLMPTPNYSVDAGLQVQAQRVGDYFISTDTTKTPGFAQPFHRILSLGASYDWAIVNNPSKATTLRSEIEQLKTELQTFYGERAKYEKTQLTPKTENYE